MFRVLGSPTPRRSEHLPDLFPVRLVLSAKPSECYFAPRGEATVFLHKRIGSGNFMVRPGRTARGRRTLVLYLRSLHDAQVVLLGLPQLALVRERMPDRTR